MAIIDEGRASGARLLPACAIMGISAKTYRRWKLDTDRIGDLRPVCSRPEPSHKLTQQEKETILKTCNEPEFASLPPSQIVPKLADEGLYLASESSFYKVLRDSEQQHHRGRSSKPQAKKEPSTHTATAPNTLWCWDITYCPSSVRGLYYYLYMIEDVFSRKIVGWEVYPAESGDMASELVEKTVLKERCFRKPLVLHSDNGSPMKSATLLSKMHDLGITPSRGRPRVSNDNAYSESLFKTMKYKPDWPVNGFASIEEAQTWVSTFVQWYNTEHCHSGIQFVSPEQRHKGEDKAVLENRRKVYEEAKKANPRRWSRNTRKWLYQSDVTLNPERMQPDKLVAA